MDQDVDEARVLSLMDHGGVYRTLLSNHLERPAESLWAFARHANGRIVPMLRTKDTQRGPNAAARWRARRRAELASGAYRGVAELLIWHQGEPELGIREVALDVDDDLVRSYFMTSHSNPVFSRIEKVKRWQNLFDGRLIASRWRPLLVAHPDRFVFALDNVFAGNWVPRRYLAQMTLWWCALGELPPHVAHAIAHGNAERLWNLPPKPPEVRAITPWAARTELGPVAGTATIRRGADVGEGRTFHGGRGRRW
jgi:hypothetical protein